MQPVQHPIIRTTALLEMWGQLAIVSVVAAAAWWFGGFSVSLIAVLIVGFGLTTMNIISCTVSQNVHLAEIRDALLVKRP
jgi:hypothetical protein